MRQALPCLLIASALALGLMGCGQDNQGVAADPKQVDSTELPTVGLCRDLTPADLGNAANATTTVDCAKSHTAETFRVQQLPTDVAKVAYDAKELATFAAKTCTPALTEFLGADESTAMRTVIGWVWFRPSEQAWGDGARWFRCDAVGGTVDSKSLVSLPPTVQGILAGENNEKWMACVNAASVNDSPRVPCSQDHIWRAVTTIRLGEADTAYPGDKDVVQRTKDFCSGSVSAWLGYPADFDFGYTWFGAEAWKVGNRRSVCWARTTR